MSSMHNVNNYFYMPSLVGACCACALFALISIALSIQMHRSKVLYPSILPVGAGCEAIGYLFRALSASHGRQESVTLFLLMNIFIILSPLAFMAGLYLIYGRLVRRLIITTTTNMSSEMCDDMEPQGMKRRRVSPLPGNLYARIFVTCDITSFMIQAAGASLIVLSNQATARTGKTILMAGLTFGFITFTSFVALVIYANALVAKSMKNKTFTGRGLRADWQVGIMLPLGVSAACILARTIYRMIEFAGGYTGHIYRTEWYMYVFDTTLMMICIGIWVPFFPAKYGLDQSLEGRDCHHGTPSIEVQVVKELTTITRVRSIVSD